MQILRYHNFIYTFICSACNGIIKSTKKSSYNTYLRLAKTQYIASCKILTLTSAQSYRSLNQSKQYDDCRKLIEAKPYLLSLINIRVQFPGEERVYCMTQREFAIRAHIRPIGGTVGKVNVVAFYDVKKEKNPITNVT